MIACPYKTSDEWTKAVSDRTGRSGAYARSGYPEGAEYEDSIAAFAGAEGALLFNSGMAAITTLVRAVLKMYDRSTAKLVVSRQLYRQTDAFFWALAKEGWNIVRVDFREEIAYTEASQDNVALVFAEVIGNQPEMPVTDLPRLFECVAKKVATVVIDNTLLTPVLLKVIPLAEQYGVAQRVFVVESATKYWQLGKNDITAGVAYGPLATFPQLRDERTMLGTYLQPASLKAWPPDSIELLIPFMRQNSDNGINFLSLLRQESFQPVVDHVWYPHAPFLRNGCGGLLYFSLKGGEKAVRKFCDSCGLPIGGSFGHAFTWVAPYGLVFHNGVVRLEIGADTDYCVQHELGQVESALRSL